MPTTFDLRLATLRAAYREGRATPRQLVAELRDKAAALNPDYHLFIHLLTLEELEPYLAALDEKSPDSLPLYGIPFAIKDNIDLVLDEHVDLRLVVDQYIRHESPRGKRPRYRKSNGPPRRGRRHTRSQGRTRHSPMRWGRCQSR